MAGRFGAVITAMVTPFRDDHGVDLDRAQELAAHLVRNGSDAVVVGGLDGRVGHAHPRREGRAVPGGPLGGRRPWA